MRKSCTEAVHCAALWTCVMLIQKHSKWIQSCRLRGAATTNKYLNYNNLYPYNYYTLPSVHSYLSWMPIPLNPPPPSNLKTQPWPKTHKAARCSPLHRTADAPGAMGWTVQPTSDEARRFSRIKPGASARSKDGYSKSWKFKSKSLGQMGRLKNHNSKVPFDANGLMGLMPFWKSMENKDMNDKSKKFNWPKRKKKHKKWICEKRWCSLVLPSCRETGSILPQYHTKNIQKRGNLAVTKPRHALSVRGQLATFLGIVAAHWPMLIGEKLQVPQLFSRERLSWTKSTNWYQTFRGYPNIFCIPIYSTSLLSSK